MSGVVMIDTLNAILWAGITGLLVAATWRISLRIETDSPAAQLMIALTIATASITGVTTVLGSAGLLSGHGIEAGVGIVAIALHCTCPGRFAIRNHAVLNSDNALWHAARICPARVWFAAAAFLFGHTLIDGLLRFPADFDCLMYHLPLMDHWLQAGSLYAPDSAFWSQPGNSEIMGLWFVAPFSGDFFAALNNVPFVVLWGVAGFSFARSLGFSPLWSHLAAAAMLSVHTIIHETDDASNDLAVVAFFMATLSFGALSLIRRQHWQVVLCGISLGLLAGVKFFAVGYAAVAWTAITIAHCANGGFGRGLRIGATLLAFSLPFGGYWYVRNFVYTGEPLFPMTLFGGTDELGYPDIWESSFAFNGDPRVLVLGMHAVWTMAGPVHYLALMLTIPVIAYLVAACFVKHACLKGPVVVRLMFAAALAGSAGILAIIPVAVEDVPGTLNHLKAAYTPIRYGLPYLSCAVFGAVLLLVDMTAGPSSAREERAFRVEQILRIGWLAAAAAAVASQVAMRICAFPTASLVWCLVVAAGVHLFAYVVIAAARAWSISVRSCVTGSCVGAVLAFAASTAMLSIRWHTGFAAHFDSFFSTPVFAEMASTLAAGDRICVLDLRAYPFFGSQRQYHVAQPRRIVSCSDLSEYIAARQVRFIADRLDLDGPIDRYQRAIPCLRQQLNRYQSIAADNGLELFEVTSDR